MARFIKVLSTEDITVHINIDHILAVYSEDGHTHIALNGLVNIDHILAVYSEDGHTHIALNGLGSTIDTDESVDDIMSMIQREREEEYWDMVRKKEL